MVSRRHHFVAGIPAASRRLCMALLELFPELIPELILELIPEINQRRGAVASVGIPVLILYINIKCYIVFHSHIHYI